MRAEGSLYWRCLAVVRRLFPRTHTVTTNRKDEQPLLRCAWARNEVMIRYHDEEWGIPVHDDGTLFEFLILEGAQAGLSWETILNKRENYRAAFDFFDPHKVARYDRKKLAQLLKNPGKRSPPIPATILSPPWRRALTRSGWSRLPSKSRATATFLSRCNKPFASTSPSRSVPSPNPWKSRQLPASTAESDAMSKDLKKRGFNFVGSTICYAFMQAVGLVNDHAVQCFRYDDLSTL